MIFPKILETIQKTIRVNTAKPILAAHRTPPSFDFSQLIVADQTAFVSDCVFDALTTADLPSLAFSADSTDRAFLADSCVVVHTDSGAYFKLGNPVESDDWVAFSTERMLQEEEE